MICSRDLDTMTTAAVVAYYGSENEVRISYAGHPPILYKRGIDKTWSYAKLPKQNDKSYGSPLNMPLAIDADTHYAQLTIPMVPGDRLFVYTDGIIDAPNPIGERFGTERLKDVLDANIETPLAELKSKVLKKLTQYIEQAPKHDDITLIALEVV